MALFWGVVTGRQVDFTDSTNHGPNFTISMWVSKESPALSRALCSVWLDISGSKDRHFLSLTSGGAASATTTNQFGATGTATGGTVSTSASGPFDHILGTFASTDRAIFVNSAFGIADATESTFILMNTLKEYGIGHEATLSLTHMEKCKIAEVAIWSSRLSGEEIVALSHRISPELIDTANLLAYLPLIDNNLVDEFHGGTWVKSHFIPDVGIHPNVFPPQSPIYT